MLGTPFHSQRSNRCLLLPSFSFLCCRPRNRRPSSMASKIVAEYAKSARSSCKKCGVSISKDELRLGVVSRDTRGFDVTKWHHFQCFPSGLTTTAEKIGGFVSLKKLDQEALVKSFAGGTETEVTSIHIAEASNNFYSGVDCQEQGKSKKLKVDICLTRCFCGYYIVNFPTISSKNLNLACGVCLMAGCYSLIILTDYNICKTCFI
ncbi:Polynucleotide 3'-phosphatase [Nymphaea thermarum]|nr:Polynucleotide 3'-phosphatase [Nymphaea thermarum]